MCSYYGRCEGGHLSHNICIVCLINIFCLVEVNESSILSITSTPRVVALILWIFLARWVQTQLVGHVHQVMVTILILQFHTICKGGKMNMGMLTASHLIVLMLWRRNHSECGKCDRFISLDFMLSVIGYILLWIFMLLISVYIIFSMTFIIPSMLDAFCVFTAESQYLSLSNSGYWYFLYQMLN